MQNPNLSFAKIVATPTDTEWSQVYNAGGLFLIVALTTNTAANENLHTLGKQIINNLEAEFFTLEKKDLPSIKSAVTTSLHDVPDTVTVSITLAYVKETILYLLIVGAGKVIMKRHDALGVLLESTNSLPEIVTASGYLANNDTVLLQSASFSHLVTPDLLKQAFELSLPSDIAETLTPPIHASEQGSASAIVIHFKGIGHTPIVKQTDPKGLATPSDSPPDHLEENESVAEIETEKEVATPSTPFTVSKKLPRFASLPKVSVKNLSTKIFVILAICIAVVLLASVYKTVQKQQQTKNEAAFHELYDGAKKDYDEGTGLLSLNPAFARDDFLSAQKKLQTGITKFKKGSPEEQQLTALLQKVNSQLGSNATTDNVDTTQADTAASPQLAALQKQKDALFAASDENSVYLLTPTAVLKDGKNILKNDNDWANPKGFAVYHGNVYILDKTILKFVAGDSGYGKSDYFTDAKPDLSQASSITIDGSIWILFTDGRIAKYTKGQSESFTIKGMDKNFSNPSAITTTIEGTSLYILDKGNNRIVVIAKDGTYKKAYGTASIATTKAFAVDETKKTILLSGDKLLTFPL